MSGFRLTLLPVVAGLSLSNGRRASTARIEGDDRAMSSNLLWRSVLNSGRGPRNGRRPIHSPIAMSSSTVRTYHTPSTSAGEASVRAPMSLVCKSSNVDPVFST